MKYTIENHAWNFISFKCWERCSNIRFMHIEIYEGALVAYIENWYSVCGILGDPTFYDVNISDVVRLPIGITSMTAFIYTVITR